MGAWISRLRAATDATGLTRRIDAMTASRKAASRPPRVSRAKARRIAEEQRALRSVATLVARGASPAVVFNAVAAELGRLLRADYTSINRYEHDRTVSVIAYWCDPDAADVLAPVSGHWPIGGSTAAATVLRTGAPARRASESVGGEIGEWFRSHGIGHVVACPITVDDRLWGVMETMFIGPEPPPGGLEERMLEFVELAACTIAQAESRAELVASRARVVATSDAARRRIERDLHDGAQQHLISLGLELRAAEASVPPQQEELRQRLSSTARGLSSVLAELQEISRGLHPAILARGGLGAALRTLVNRVRMPVELHFDTIPGLTDQVEVTVYYIVSEALTNVLKHAQASEVRIDVRGADAGIRISIRDDGLGGADFGGGSGLIGLKDRVEALGGTMRIASPVGEGTSLFIKIPVARD